MTVHDDNHDALAILTGRRLLEKQRKLIVAESCTGGMISHRITNVPGSSAYFLGGVLAYSYEAKRYMLGVNPDTLLLYGAVSRETVLEMAQGARKLLANEFPVESIVAAAVSGILGPGGGMPGKPVGLVWIGLSAQEGDYAWKFNWQGDRIENKTLSSNMTLNLINALLQGSLAPNE